MAASIAKTPEPPYYVVIFTSQLRSADEGYAQMADRMMELAAQQPGFLGAESVRGADDIGITVSYWTDEAAIANWKKNAEHLVAQRTGMMTWYADYRIRIAKVERAYGK